MLASRAMVRTLCSLAFCAALLAGCKQEPKPAAEAPRAATAPAAPATAPAGQPETAPAAGEGGAAGHRKMANCPSGVDGAMTSIAPTESAVEVTITAKDEAATTEIRARAKKLGEIGAQEVEEPRHTGEGRGGGQLGSCPVVMTGTRLAVADVDGGVKVTVTPLAADKLEWLKTESEKRRAKLEGGAAP